MTDECGWSDDCLECHDVGVISEWCPGVGRPADLRLRPGDMAVVPCERLHRHDAHTVGRPCGCVHTNATYQRHHREVKRPQRQQRD